MQELFSMPLAGLEPARIAPLDFESSASANSATAAYDGLLRETMFDYITNKITLQQLTFIHALF